MHTLNLGCSFITLRDTYNNQRPRCKIAWLHYANHFTFDCLTLNSENRGINITCMFTMMTYLKTIDHIGKKDGSGTHQSIDACG